MKKSLQISLLLILCGALVAANTFGRRLQPSRTQSEQLRALQSRVVGGENAERGFAPYQIALTGMYWEFMCGGVIIDEQWVLTAAHCVYGFNPPYLRIISGTNVWHELGFMHFVDEYYVHCNYNEPMYANDIALVHLNETIKWNEYTQPIEIIKTPLKDGDDVILTGWGSTVLWGQSPDNLQKINLKYLSYSTCKKQIEDPEDLDVGHICSFTKQGEGSCHGDSGGPLVTGDRKQLVGLVDWGIPCATGTPDAYTSVLFFRDWIQRTMSGCKNCHCSASNYDV